MKIYQAKAYYQDGETTGAFFEAIYSDMESATAESEKIKALAEKSGVEVGVIIQSLELIGHRFERVGGSIIK